MLAYPSRECGTKDQNKGIKDCPGVNGGSDTCDNLSGGSSASRNVALDLEIGEPVRKHCDTKLPHQNYCSKKDPEHYQGTSSRQRLGQTEVVTEPSDGSILSEQNQEDGEP